MQAGDDGDGLADRSSYFSGGVPVREVCEEGDEGMHVQDEGRGGVECGWEWLYVVVL